MASAADGRVPLPKGFKSIYEWKDHLGTGVNFNVIGIVAGSLPVEKTRGTGYQRLLELHDDLSWNPGLKSGGLEMKYFHDDPANLPDARLGDVVLLRSIKARTWSGKQICVSNFGTVTLLFRDDASQQWNMNDDGHLRYEKYPKEKPGAASLEEQRYIRWLKQWSRDKEGLVSENAPARNGASASRTSISHVPLQQLESKAISRKFALLKDVAHRGYYDVVVQVIKVHQIGLGKEIYVTDYTANPMFYHYPEPGGRGAAEDDYPEADPYGNFQARVSARHNWPGPYGKHVVCVTAFQPHASFDVKENDFVSMRNLRIIVAKQGQHLEGKLHTDSKYPDRIDIAKIKASPHFSTGHFVDKVEEIKLRQAAYWKDIRRRIQSLRLPQEAGKEPSKKAKRKEKKRKRAEAEAEARLSEEQRASKRRETNANVRCSHADLPVTSIANIIHADRSIRKKDTRDLELPFINKNVRAHVRVVDFFPANLEDFCQWVEHVPLASGDSENWDITDVAMNDGEESIHGNTDVNGKWEWRFCLLVEDAGVPRGAIHQDYLKLYFGPDNADYLLKDLSAADLRRDKRALDKLRERMFILWGDLQEVKAKEDQVYDPATERPNNRPFHCCIQEYGVVGSESSGPPEWVRCHRMVWTTINTDG